MNFSLTSMSIIKFSVPTDSKISHDINISNKVNFIGNGSVLQNLKETVYIRKFKVHNEQYVRKIIYKKEGVSWMFNKFEFATI